MKLAMWLFQRFGVLERNESLVGDLVQERSAGRSLLWFWWQAAAAIADTVARNLREHWLLALRAIVMGWALNLAGAQAISALVRHEMGRMHPGPWTLLNAAILFTFSVWPAILGWTVARTHRAQQAAMVLAFAASTVIYASWDLTVHYSQMKSCVQCIPDQWDTNLVLNCIFVILTLAGGFVQRPSKRIA